MSRNFITAARLYLGLPVTKDVCNIAGCDGAQINTHGHHSYHAQAYKTKRHTRVKFAIGDFFRGLHSAGRGHLYCQYETSMSVIGKWPLREGAPDVRDALIDIYFEDLNTHDIIIGDVMVTQPKIEEVGASQISLYAAGKGVQAKYDRYLPNYEIDKGNVIPLVFESYGGYADVTMKFLRELCHSMAMNDDKLASALMRDLRERIAMAIHAGNYEIINWINQKERNYE
jgi:hypothetical protein